LDDEMGANVSDQAFVVVRQSISNVVFVVVVVERCEQRIDTAAADNDDNDDDDSDKYVDEQRRSVVAFNCAVTDCWCCESTNLSLSRARACVWRTAFCLFDRLLCCFWLQSNDDSASQTSGGYFISSNLVEHELCFDMHVTDWQRCAREIRAGRIACADCCTRCDVSLSHVECLPAIRFHEAKPCVSKSSNRRTARSMVGGR
jgi:hypothetical protein